MEKITKRAMYEEIITMITGEGEVQVSEEEIVEFCHKEIAQLDKKAEKAKERATAKKAEADELTAIVKSVMSAETFEPIAEIASRIEGEDVTVAKVQYRLRKLAEAGEAEKTELTIPGGEGVKARKVVGYKLV